MKRKILIVIMLLLILSGCDTASMKEKLQNSPTNQINSYWESDNGAIFLSVDKDGKITGYIVSGDVIPIRCSFAIRNDFVQVFQIINPNSINSDLVIEKWNGIEIESSEQFSVIVKETTYFKPEEAITSFQISQNEYEDILGAN